MTHTGQPFAYAVQFNRLSTKVSLDEIVVVELDPSGAAPSLRRK